MTYIKKLIINGFKSFGKRTEIEFKEGFNAIIGANGSGKSNILDAICFVLGRLSAKGLRVDKSSNLIYNGGKKGKPAKKAVVEIILDNSKKIFPVDEKEVKISRILKQSGQSDYLINGRKATRQQILELLSYAKIDPEGYNIVLQGDIIRFTEMSSIERRQIIEEVSGIKIYEDKKEKALRELAKVEEKINEVKIIIKEKETYLEELKKDYEEAKKYKDLKDKIDVNKVTVLTYYKEKVEKELEKIEEEQEKVRSSLDKKLKELEDIENKIEEEKKKIEELNKEIEKRGEKQQLEVQKEIEKIKIDIGVSEQRIEAIEREIKELKEREVQLNIELDRVKKEKEEKENKIKMLENEKKRKEKYLDGINKKLQDIKKKYKLDEIPKIEKESMRIEEQIEQLNEELMELRKKEQEMMREADKLEIILQNIDSKLEKIKLTQKQNKEGLETLKRLRERYKSIVSTLSKKEDRFDELNAELANAKSKLIKKKEELGKLELQQRIYYGQKGAFEVVKKLKELFPEKVYGLVSQLGSVDQKYSLALDTAAGGHINDIIVEDADTASKCIKWLKKNKAGYITFLPLKELNVKVDKKVVKSKSEGIIDYAINLIKYKKKYEKAFYYIFQDTLVVKNIDVAKKVGIGKGQRMVTLEGDLVEAKGVMKGGYMPKEIKGGFSSAQLSEEIERLEKEKNEIEKIVKRLEQERSILEKEINDLKREKPEIEGEIIKLEKTLRIDSEDLEATKMEKEKINEKVKEIKEELNKLRNEIMGKERSIINLKIKKQELRNKLMLYRDPEVSAQLNSLEEEKSKVKEEINKIEGEIKLISNEIKNIVDRELNRLNKIISQSQKEKKDFEEEKNVLKEKILELKKLLKEKEAEERKFFAKFKDLFRERNKISKTLEVLEDKEEKVKEDIKVLEMKNHDLTIQKASKKGELERYKEELERYKGIEPMKNVDDIKKLEKEIREFERMLDSIGSVNLRALEIYEKAKEELERIKERESVLEKEKEEVLILINQIETKKKELFLKTFNILNKNFRSIFKLLSYKGEAYLEIEDPKDIFNKGVVIKVKISSNKFLDIRSLSGGEKTITALAFIFAIQEYDPAYFYILDEVDAALDKKNSEKLGLLLREYSQKAQYIIISHNDNVIQQADFLYGVSLDETNSSKVISLKLE